MKIHYYNPSMDVFEIWINSIGREPEIIRRCAEITREFATGKIFFWGFYMTDGINLTNDQWDQYTEEIPDFFQTYGKYEEIYETCSNGKNRNTPLSIARSPIHECTYEMFPKLFHYHLETNFFSPKITWEVFEKSFRNYVAHGCNDYVKNKFTDFLFSYVDSGDFIFRFNPEIFDKEKIVKKSWRSFISNLCKKHSFSRGVAFFR